MRPLCRGLTLPSLCHLSSGELQTPLTYLCHGSLSIPPENTKKSHETSTNKTNLKKLNVTSSKNFFHFWLINRSSQKSSYLLGLTKGRAPKNSLNMSNTPLPFTDTLQNNSRAPLSSSS